MTKKTTKFFIAGGTLMLISLVIGLHLNVIKTPITKTIQLSYVADFADDNVLVGASHNIFVGKVITEFGNKKLGSPPETQFIVEVIKNIKGELTGEVTVNQLGGYENGILYTTGGEIPFVENTDIDPNYLLQSGQTYLFATRYNKEEEWYTLNSFPTARKLISDEKSLSIDLLSIVASADQRVQQLEIVYPNEILLNSDKLNNNTRNSYESFQKNK